MVTTVESVERYLGWVAGRSPELAGSPLAAAVMVLAREIDSEGNSATSKSMCVRALLEAMAELRAQLPAERERDGVDDLSSRRQRRRAGAVAG